MRVGRKPAIALLLLFLILPAAGGDARASFERLPGPAAGRSGDWVWDWPAHPGKRRGVRLALGTPATIPGLGWTHARARAAVARWRFEGDAYLLALEDLYRESAVGVWWGRDGLAIGARRWDVAWNGGPRRAGWTLSAESLSRVRRFEIDIAAQDVRIGHRDTSAPPHRFSGRVQCRLSSLLRIGAAVFRDPAGSGYLGNVRWEPLPGLSFQETVRAPGGTVESGMEVRAGDVTVGLWLEPSSGLGSRVGISCAFE